MNTYLQQFYNHVENLKKNYPEIMFYLNETDDEHTVYIESIMRLNPTKTRKGIGKEFLKKYCFICDSYGMNTELTIEDESGFDKLTKFYESVGFFKQDFDPIFDDDTFIRMRRDHNSKRT